MTPVLKYPLALILVTIATLGGLVALLHSPPAWHLDVGAPGDARTISGFYRDEWDGDTNFRWSEPQAQVALYGTSAAPSRLTMRLHTDVPPSLERRHRLHIRHDEQEIAHFTLTNGWRVYHTLLPEGVGAGRGFQPEHLTLAAQGYRPTTADGRELGVPLDWLEVAPLDTMSVPMDVPLERAALLVWGVLVLAGLFWHLNAALEPYRPWPTALAHVTAQAAGVGGVLALWAWVNPFVLAWAWSFPLWILAAASALVVVLAGLRRLPVYLPWSSLTERVPSVPRIPLLPTLAALFLLLHVLLAAPLSVAVRGSVAWLLVGMPGALLMVWLFRHHERGVRLVFLALCGGVMLPPLLLLPIQALPGAVPWWALLLVCDALSVGGGVLLWRDSDTPDSTALSQEKAIPAPVVLLLLVVLGVAGVVRFAHLGSAEFQGDEGQVIHMAAALLHGQDEILLLHRKGPMEILLAAVPMVVTGHVNEWTARFPFAVAGMGCLVGCFVLARRLLASNGAGVLVVALLALEGFMIAFSRIVQYQHVVLLTTIAGVWACWRFYEGAEHRRYLTLAAASVAIGLMGHYDAIFGVPVMAWFVLAGGMRRGWRGRQWVDGLRWPVPVGAALLASFYVPFVLHEHFQRTIDYLLNRRIGERDITGLSLNNLLEYYPLITFYNTTFQMVTYAVLLTTALVAWLLCYGRPRVVGAALALLLLAGAVVMGWAPGWFKFPRFNAAIIAFALPLAGLALSPATPAPLRLLVLWFSVPFVAESFLIADPNTHFYTMHPAAVLLLVYALVQAVRWLRARRMRWLLSPLVGWGAALLVLTLPYHLLIFVQQEPEYERRFPFERPPIYLASYGDRTPRGGYFGFPHRDGWKVIGELYREGVLDGNYDSNQKSLITTWYIRDGERGGGEPYYYFAVQAKGYLFVPDGYDPIGSVMVDGREALIIYSRDERETLSPDVFYLRDYVDRFDAQPVPNLPLSEGLLEIDPRDLEELLKERD